MTEEDYMILGFSFLLSAICALANLVSKEFRRHEDVIHQIEAEMQEVKQALKEKNVGAT